MRILALIKKEFLSIIKDKQNSIIVFLAPLIQLLIFSFSINLDIKNIDLAIFNQSNSKQTKEILYKFEGSKYIRNIYMVKSYEEANKLLELKKAISIVVFPPNFGIKDNNIQVISDGRRSNSAQIAESYILSITNENNSLEIRNLYNPNLNNYWWILPSVFGSVSLISAFALTAMSIARERELGTFDQILVSPLSAFQIMLGKLIPAIIISIFNATIILLIAFFGFNIPLIGDLWLLYLGVIVFLFSVCGIGLFVSSISKTQQQAILYTFVFLLPSFLLSGFATPVENTPNWLEPFTNLVTLKYYLLFLRSIFLKDISFIDSLEYLMPMFLIGVASFIFAMQFFKRKSS